MTNDQGPMTKRKRSVQTPRCDPQQTTLEVYQVIIHCRDEAEQRRLYEQLTRHGHRCRLTLL